MPRLQSTVFYALSLLYLFLGCGKKKASDVTSSEPDPAQVAAGSQPIGGQSGQWRRSIADDTTPPQVLTSLVAKSGDGLGQIILNFSYPELSDDYAKIEFRRLKGNEAPDNCSKGDLALTLSDFSKRKAVDSGLYPGDLYSYSACIYDAAGNESILAADSPAPAAIRQRIFATSIATFDGNLKATYGGKTFSTSLEGADYRCQSLANSSGLYGEWQALIGSLPDRNPRYHVQGFGPIYNFASEPQLVANNIDDFWRGELRNAVGYDETGTLAEPVFDSTNSNIVSSFVYSSFSGYGFVLPQYTCSDWSTNSSSSYHVPGNSTAADGYWAWIGSTLGCNKKGRLYCIETLSSDYVSKPTLSVAEQSAGTINVTIAFPSDVEKISKIVLIRHPGKNFTEASCRTYHPYGVSLREYNGTDYYSFDDVTYTDNIGSEGWFRYSACVYDQFGNIAHQVFSSAIETGSSSNYKRAFITAATYDGSLGGVSGANTKCSTAASNAGLSGTWKAILADSTNSISNNLTFSAYTFDFGGNFVGRYSYDITGGYKLSLKSISTDENGTAMSDSTKIWTGSTAYGSISGSNCSDWASNSAADSGTYGEAASSWTTSWLSSSVTSCDSVAHLYCIEQ